MKIVSLVKFVTVLNAPCPGSVGGDSPRDNHTRGAGFTLTIQEWTLRVLADLGLAVLTP
jgi:hypothetical protein